MGSRAVDIARKLGRGEFSPEGTADNSAAASAPGTRVKAQGKIRFYGMALGTEAQALKAIRETGVSTLMLTFNILNQTMAREVLPAARERGVGIIVRQPLASGLLSGELTPETHFAANDYRKTWPREKYLDDLRKVEAVKEVVGDAAPTLPRVALRFILAHPAVSAVVPGMMSTEQVDDGRAAGEDSPLPSAIVEKLRGL